jgi:hypothetical protein
VAAAAQLDAAWLPVNDVQINELQTLLPGAW